VHSDETAVIGFSKEILLFHQFNPFSNAVGQLSCQPQSELTDQIDARPSGVNVMIPMFTCFLRKLLQNQWLDFFSAQTAVI
jgi:hypothetical protein